MTVPGTPSIHQPDLASQALRRAAEEIRRAFNNSPIIDGALLESQPFAAGDTVISHTLGRKWRGYVITRIRSGIPATLQDASTQPSDPTKQLAVTSASAFVGDAWVF